MESVPTETPDWNVVVTLAEQTLQEACRLLRRWGKIRRTGFYNALGLVVEEPRRFLEDFAFAIREQPGLLNFVSHVVPADHVFDFHDEAEFAARAQEAVLGWLPHLTGKTFKIRMHRHGLKGMLHAHDEEHLLADATLSHASAAAALSAWTWTTLTASFRSKPSATARACRCGRARSGRDFRS